MLTDMIEGEFDMKEEEPWYDHQDLQHDLHLAAELGKNLLEQNRDLEETLQQMCITNQEQIQEIEYLSKQVDLLRSVNDQHAKVYEQLDATSQELEQKNQRLLQENRAAQMKIQGLSETVDGLQTQVEELQREMKTLKLLSAEHQRPRAHQNPHEESCQSHRLMALVCVSPERSVSSSCCCVNQEGRSECWELMRSVRSLQEQLSSERAQREAAEQEADALAHQISHLEPKAALMGAYKERLEETEAEVQELRLLLRSSRVDLSLDDDVGVAGLSGRGLQRCSSERQLRGDERPEVKRGGISLLNEMDTQYAALQEKYDTLLRRCEDGTATQSHKPALTHTRSQSVNIQDEQPEYKTLFQEIFTFIHKSKNDLKENRIGQDGK